MANKEQLAILEQGVEVWNKWRAKNRNVGIYLQGAHLVGADLRGANLSGAHLFLADLNGATFFSAYLTKGKLIWLKPIL